VIACGFSGHGFKFSSVIGEILAELTLKGKTRHDISLFSLQRLKNVNTDDWYPLHNFNDPSTTVTSKL